MPKRSAGILLYRLAGEGFEVLIVHPGGPFWARRDEGAWSIPKGEHEDGEDARLAAFREFEEETGHRLPHGEAVDLGDVRQKGGKIVRAFAMLGDLDPSALLSNTIEIAWPPRTGRRLVVPEVDRAGWFAPALARAKLVEAQRDFLDRLEQMLRDRAARPLLSRAPG